MASDVVVPHEVEHRLRRLHPPEEHEARLEEARTYYRVLRDDRKKELADARAVQQVEPAPVLPTAEQKEKILVRKRRKTPRRRKVLVYPQSGSARVAPKSTHEEGMWERTKGPRTVTPAQINAETRASQAGKAQDAYQGQVRKMLVAKRNTG